MDVGAIDWWSVLNVWVGGFFSPFFAPLGHVKVPAQWFSSDLLALFVNTCQSLPQRECVFEIERVLSEHHKRHASVSDGGWLSGLRAAPAGTWTVGSQTAITASNQLRDCPVSLKAKCKTFELNQEKLRFLRVKSWADNFNRVFHWMDVQVYRFFSCSNWKIVFCFLDYLLLVFVS